MAAIVTGTTTGSVDTSSLDQATSDIRRELAFDTADVRRDIAQVASDTRQEVSQTSSDLRLEVAQVASDVRQEVSQASSDMRQEQAADTGTLKFDIKDNANEAIKETLKATSLNTDATKDARYDLVVQGVANTDRILASQTANYIAAQSFAFDQARDLAALQSHTALGLQKVSSDAALQVAQLGAAVQLGQGVIERTIFTDGNATRALINELKYADLNRALIERNTDLVEERASARANQYGAQFAQLLSMMQNKV